jgi:hypothetical protein
LRSPDTLRPHRRAVSTSVRGRTKFGDGLSGRNFGSWLMLGWDKGVRASTLLPRARMINDPTIGL